MLKSANGNMEKEIEAIVHDVNLYSDGLVLALKNSKYDEAEEYVKKMKDQLTTVKTYLRLKKKLKKNLEKK